MNNLKRFGLISIMTIIAVLLFLLLRNVTCGVTQGVTFGLALGVFFGFIADLWKKSLDDFFYQNKIRNSFLVLLSYDAINFYKTVENDRKAEGSKLLSGEVVNLIPQEFKIPFWLKLSNEENFQVLTNEKHFKEIVDIFYDIDRLNQEILKNSPFAIPIFKDTIKNSDIHKRLLSIFEKINITKNIVKNFKKKIDSNIIM